MAVPPTVRRPLAALLLACAALGPAACGGGGGGGTGGQNVERLLDSAFTRPLRSATIAIEAELDVHGLPGVSKPLLVQATGPYRANRDRLPSFDIDLKVATDGGGQTVSTGRLSTGDRAYVKFEDSFFELPRAEVERANRDIRRQRGRRPALRGIGLNLRPWLLQAQIRGGASVGGVPTTHLSGTLATRRVLADLNRFLRTSSSTLSATAGDVPRPLSQAQIARVARAIRNPTFDVYVGKRDGYVRRLSASLRFDVPKADRAGLRGLRSGTLRFSIQLSDVNGDQRIEAPARAHPLSDLTSQLGSAAALSGGLQNELQGGAAGGSGRAGGQTGGTATGGGTEGDAFKRYAACLDRAKPQDTAALQRCANLLR